MWMLHKKSVLPFMLYYCENTKAQIFFLSNKEEKFVIFNIQVSFKHFEQIVSLPGMP